MQGFWIAWLALVSFAPQPALSQQQVTPAAEVACEKGDAAQCADAATDYREQGKADPAKMAKAARLFQQACDAGDPYGCTGLAGMYYRGEGAATDKPRAYKLFVKSCDAGHAKGCAIAAMMLGKGEGAAEDFAQAAALFVRACDLGDAESCGYAGTAVYGGYAGKADPVRAIAMWEKACDGNFAKSCFELGLAYKHGEGQLPRDAAKASEMFDKACKLGDSRGCPGK